MPTGPYQYTLANGQVWLSSSRQKTCLLSMFVTTSDGHQHEECSAWSPMPEQTFSVAMALAHWQSGSKTISSSESHAIIWPDTTYSVQSGKRRSKSKWATGKSVAGYGTEGRSFQVVNQSLTKNVPCLLSPPLIATVDKTRR